MRIVVAGADGLAAVQVALLDQPRNGAVLELVSGPTAIDEARRHRVTRSEYGPPTCGS